MKIFSKIILSLVILFTSTNLFADTEWQRNKLRVKKQQAVFDETINEIPIYEEKLTGNYEIIGPVRGQDIISRNKEAIFRQVRSQAYKMDANAIMEFKCRKGVKNIFQSCNGFAIKQ